jgi:hypothetical protein
LYILSSGTYCVCRTIGQKIPLFCWLKTATLRPGGIRSNDP